MGVRPAESAFELSNIILAGLTEEEDTQAVDTQATDMVLFLHLLCGCCHCEMEKKLEIINLSMRLLRGIVCLWQFLY